MSFAIIWVICFTFSLLSSGCLQISMVTTNLRIKYPK
uniref:Uncharacterized protein n=1 Tax=Siphoviridae sp. ctiV651 TaxID=2827917 RepID=A0A8S5S4U0_9CAUD|nr:MAG TPA: hypothetical protein [Siphoviridae sp. ctiV651]